MRSSWFCPAALAAGAYAQSVSYTDVNTGIIFQGKTDPSGFQFGLALPQDVGSDFIGQMIIPSNGSGYGGVSLAGSMVGSLLVVAWPYEGSVMASLRETSGYTSPDVYKNTSVSLSVISKGTFVNKTHFAYTFLCSGCITRTPISFSEGSDDIVLGWGMSAKAITNPSSSSGATFVYHEAGFGNFGLTLSKARSANYAAWARIASPSGSTGNGTVDSTGKSTCSSTSRNTTVTISNSTYEYIVAGAGPAGIIVAQRLAETGKSVLLLERGAESTYATGGRSTVAWNNTVTQYDVPAMAYHLTTASDTSEYCTDVANMAGCILGGGTMVNALMFVRPQEADFSKWPLGWKWSDVSGSAAELYERNPGTTLASQDGKRYDQSAFYTISTFLKSMGWSQVDAIKQPNEKTAVYSYPPWDIQGGVRAGPVKSYLPRAKALPNFKLSIDTKVVRVVRSGSTVSGVEVESSVGRQIINLKASGSVILASGAMSSPRILFNSGIGPMAQIETVQNGCSPVDLPDKADWINLPVGEKIMDHPIYTLTFNVTDAASQKTKVLVASDFTAPSKNDIDLFAKATGPLVQGGQRIVFWTSLNTTNGTQYFQGTCTSPSTGTVSIKLYLTHGLTSSGTLGIDNNGATIFTKNPWMNTEQDKTSMINMIDTILAAAKKSGVMVPSNSSLTGASLVKSNSYTTGSHFVGSTRMGSHGSAVVDTDTKVYGTNNLFVVDAGIHPDLPTGNTQAIVMVVAEHAAKRIIALGSNPVSGGSNTTVPGPSSLPQTPAENSDSGDEDGCEPIIGNSPIAIPGTSSLPQTPLGSSNSHSNNPNHDNGYGNDEYGDCE